MSDKKVDGIKKMSKNELEKSRELVLQSISEYEKTNQPQNAKKAVNIKKVDGIFSFREKIKNSEFGLTPALAKTIKREKKGEGKLKKTTGKEEAAEFDLAGDFLKSEEKLEKEEETRKGKEEKLIKKDLKIKKKREREEKKKKKEAEKKKKLEEKLKFKREKKENRRKKINSFKEGIKKLFSGFIKGIKIILSRTVKIFLASLIVFILSYTVFAVILLKLDVDTKATRLISEYFVVPAIITRNGIIEYYAYQDTKRFTLTNIDKNNKESIKLATVEMVVVSDLAKKYGLIVPEGNIYDIELRDEIVKRLALDTSINQVGINRIKKIKEMIDEGDDFVRTSNKYGDLQDLITISEQNENQIAYSQKVKDLEVNEISDIIYMPEGYYIFRCYDKSSGRSDLSYVFVKAKSLGEYIAETVRGYSLWSLAE